MGTLRLLLLFCLAIFSNLKISNGDDVSKNPRIVIIGAGPAGIAAASKLFESGFNNVTVLEAEDRIGGRVYTTKFGNYQVDLGGQWVHGVKGNVVFNLAYPMGLLDTKEDPTRDASDNNLVDSTGNSLEDDLAKNLTNFFFKYVYTASFDDNTPYKSVGEYVEKKFEEIFEKSPEILKEKKKYLHFMEMNRIGDDAAESWRNVSIPGLKGYRVCEGDTLTNWKTRGYSTILDILMKRYPDPEKELPVLNNTKLNTEVTSVDYSTKTEGSAPVVIKTANGESIEADHVIVAVSVGVLKAKHKTLFTPPLSEKKAKTIESVGYGDVGKIFLLFEKPFWADTAANSSKINFAFVWNDDDKKLIESDPEKMWLLGVTEVFDVEHKPNLLALWLSGSKYAKAMEELPENKVFEHSVEHLRRFLGKKYNVTTPLAMLRSRWYSNPHFRGTYSYNSMKMLENKVSRESLEEPINVKNLEILFAGEATNVARYSTVDGAIESGWKAADRLIDLYKNADKKGS